MQRCGRRGRARGHDAHVQRAPPAARVSAHGGGGKRDGGTAPCGAAAAGVVSVAVGRGIAGGSMIKKKVPQAESVGRESGKNEAKLISRECSGIK